MSWQRKAHRQWMRDTRGSWGNGNNGKDPWEAGCVFFIFVIIVIVLAIITSGGGH